MSYRDSQRYRKVYSYYRPVPRVPDNNFTIDKEYVDLALQGLDWKQSVRVATTSNIFVDSSISSIDGVTLADEDRVLVKNQNSPEENGIYVWYSSTQMLVRALDAQQDTLTSGAACYVEEGPLAGSAWLLSTQDPITVGTTSQTWVQFGASSIFTVSAQSAKTPLSATFGGNLYPNQVGSDVFFFVSGSTDQKSVFGGDVVVSGSLVVNGELFAQVDLIDVSGSIVASDGLTGSLTSLPNGDPYLVAGPWINLATNSLGQIEISSSFVQEHFFTITGSHAKSTSSIALGSDFIYADQRGSDVFFYVSGSLDGKNKTVFGGDVRVSGTLALGTGSAYIRIQDQGDVVLSPHKDYIYAGSDVFFFVSGSPGDSNKSLFGGDVKSSGSMVGLGGFTGSLTQLSDGTAYLRAGSGVEITTGSRGQVTVSLSPAPKLVWNEKVGRGNGVDTIFKLKYAPCSSDTAMVFIDGVLQEHSVDLVISDFSIVGQFIIFNFIPEAGTKIVVTYSYM